MNRIYTYIMLGTLAFCGPVLHAADMDKVTITELDDKELQHNNTPSFINDDGSATPIPDPVKNTTLGPVVEEPQEALPKPKKPHIYASYMTNKGEAGLVGVDVETLQDRHCGGGYT